MRDARALLVIVLALLLAGCRTTGGSVVSGGGDGAGQTRDNIGKLEEHQTESSNDATTIAGDSRTLAEQLGELGTILAAGAGDDEEFASILRRIRERPATAIVGVGNEADRGGKGTGPK